MSDEEIISRHELKDITILEIMLKKYKRYIDAILLSYEKYDKDELNQEATIGLYKAIRSYKKEHNVLFKTYATTCMKNEINTYIRKKQTKKNSIMENSISIHNSNEDEEYIKEIPDGQNSDPLSRVIEKETNKEFKNVIKQVLSKFEYEVFKEYINGSSYIEIAEKLNVSKKAADNAMQRIKNKILNILNT